MTDPWDMTPAQRMQFREAHAEAKRDRPPSKPWRVTTTTASRDTTTTYRGEQVAYDAINSRTIDPALKAGDKFIVQHWEDGRWVLYERAVITEHGWEPA